MSRRSKTISLVVFHLLSIFVSYGQTAQPVHEMLKLVDRGYKIENVISLDISGSDYQNIKSISGRKITVRSRLLLINGDTLNPEEIKTHGQTTLYYRRKSFSFSLESKASFRNSGETRRFEKFFLLSLSMDRNYHNNRLAFEMMENARLFHLFYAFCELRINRQTEGICLVVERPEDWSMEKKDSPLLIRRGYNGDINKLKTGKKTSKEVTKNYSRYFRQIYQYLNKYKGEELYNSISTWFDTDMYMKWLALNFFIRNGDYTDEAYFYVDPVSGKFRIIPWDYDDIFSKAPHEGYEESKKLTGDKLFFSTEDPLDRKIVNDPYMYRMYLVQFEELLNELSPDVLKNIFEKTYAELYPYFSDNDIISQSRYDRYKNADLDKLKSDLSTLYENLIFSRNIYLNSIEKMSK